MKYYIIPGLLVMLLLTACGSSNENKEETTQPEKTETSTQLYACPMHPEITGNKGEKCSKCGMELTVPVSAGTTTPPPATGADTTKPISPAKPPSFSIDDIVSSYLKLKNALIKDDGKAAGAAGQTLVTILQSTSTGSLAPRQKSVYDDLATDAREHAEHIGDNPGKIDHQREHFALLSKDIADLVKNFGAGQQLYLDFCPMYDDGKGATWISEYKAIKNPYYGSQMLTCGSVKKVY